MTVTLDPVTEERLQRELARGVYESPSELIAHALELVAAEEDWLIRNKQAIHSDLDRTFAQATRGEGHSPEESRVLLAQHRAARPA